MVRALRPQLQDREQPAPLSEPEFRASAIHVLGRETVDWAVLTAHRLCHYVLEGVPTVGGGRGPELVLRRSAESRIIDILLHLTFGTEPEHATDYAVTAAQDFARRGVPLSDALAGITRGHQFVSHVLLSVVEDTVAPADRFRTGRAIGDLLFRYHNVQLAGVATAYHDEWVQWTASSDATRRATATALIDGDDVDPQEASGVLGYDLTGHHVGLIAWRDGVGRVPGLRAAFRRACEDLGCGAPLVVHGDELTTWVWLGRPSQFVGDVARILDTRVPAGVRIAVGDEAHGVAGFRMSHRTASRARRMALTATGNARVVEHRTAGLAALLLDDREAAEWFTDRELGELALDDGWSATLRSTLQAYLESGCVLVDTAATLDVARNTVVYRVRRAEELLGHPARFRIAEVLAALQIARYRLAGDV